jgi:hypothetical protein
MKRFYIDLVTCEIIPESEYDFRWKNGAASGVRYFGEYRTRQEAQKDLRKNCRYLIDRY